jgi:hypothetical protein
MSDPWSQFPDAPAADPWAAFPDAQAPGGTDTPPLARAPELIGQPEERGLGRSLMLGAQAAGRGLVEAVLSPVDLAARAANVPLMAADMVADQFGGRVPFRFGEDLGDRAANTAGRVAESVGLELAQPEGIKEKAIYEATRFGAGAAGTSGALKKLSDVLTRVPTPAVPGAPAASQPAAQPIGFGMDALLAPYKGSGARVIIGDTAAGAGGGAFLAGSREYTPKEWRDAGGGLGGVMADLGAQLVGGGAGGIASEIARGLPVSFGRRIANSFTDTNFPVDPQTGIPYRRGQVEKAARDYKANTTDPAKSAANIARETDYYRSEGLPLPTSGLMSDDLGMAGMERGQRDKLGVRSMVADENADPATKAQYSFVERDNALQTRAVEEVKALSPDGSNPRQFTEAVDNYVGGVRRQAQDAVDTLDTDARAAARDLESQAAALKVRRGDADNASREIDKVYRDARGNIIEQNKQNFDPERIDPTGGVQVDTTPLANAASTLKQKAAALPPSVRESLFPGALLDDLESVNGASLENLNEIRLAIATKQAEAQSAQNYRLSDNLKLLKDDIDTSIKNMAASGSPAGDRVREALDYSRETVVPNLRRGVGGDLDQIIKRDDTGTALPPGETAGRFLTSKESAEDLLRIARTANSEATAVSAAERWLFGKLAETGVADNGRIDPDALVIWRDTGGNAKLLDTIPGFRKKFDDLLLQSRNKGVLADETQEALRKAQRDLQRTEADLRKRPLGKIEGANPRVAVARALGDGVGDPRQAMREIVDAIGNDPKAKDGLKNALSAHLIEKTTIGIGEKMKTTADDVFNKNREALAEVFSPEEMNRLQRARKLVEPLDRKNVQANPGSSTAERSMTWLPLEVILKVYYGMLKGGGMFANFKKTVGALGTGANEAVERIKMIAAFSPEGAQRLLTLKTQKPGTPGYNATLQKLIRLNEALNTVNENDKEDEARPRNEITVTPRPQ